MGKMEAPVGDEHLRAIGQITVNFALLQSTISFFIWFLLGNDLSFEQQRLGQIVTAQLPFQRLLDLLGSLFIHRTDDPEVIAELKRLLARASEARDKRNLVTHSIWAAGSTRETVARIKATAKRTKGFKHHFEEMSVEDLDGIADFIAEVAGDIQQFMLGWIEKSGAQSP